MSAPSTSRSIRAGESSRYGVWAASSTRLRDIVDALLTAACCCRSSRYEYILASTSALRVSRARSYSAAGTVFSLPSNWEII